MYDTFETNRKPYCVVLNISRKNVDVNRRLSKSVDDKNDESANNAVEIYQIYHNKIETYIAQMLKTFPFVFIIDFHGQGHRKGCAELGYLVSGSKLRSLASHYFTKSEAKKQDEEYLKNKSSLFNCLKYLKQENLTETPLLDLLFGEYSFGSLLSEHSFSTIPSLKQPVPCTCSLDNSLCNCKFFSGGYTIQKYCKQTKYPVFGVQIETPTDWRADLKVSVVTPDMKNLELLAVSLKKTIDSFLKYNFQSL